MINKAILFLLVLGVCCGCQQKGSYESVSGVVKELPLQSSTNKSHFEYKEFRIEPKASFSLTGRILGKKKYYAGREAKLATYDLALGWGSMSDSTVINQLKISQNNRWYNYYYKNPPPIPVSDIVKNSANMHLIPANDIVTRAIAGVQKGQIISFDGYLVNVFAPDGWRWYTSLSRNDSGAGACELIWVENFWIEEEYVSDE